MFASTDNSHPFESEKREERREISVSVCVDMESTSGKRKMREAHTYVLSFNQSAVNAGGSYHLTCSHEKLVHLMA